MKGADVVMQTIVQYNDWLEEEVKGHEFHEGMYQKVKELDNLLWCCDLFPVWEHGKGRTAYSGGGQKNINRGAVSGIWCKGYWLNNICSQRHNLFYLFCI